jgi:hypothetical protein
MNVKGQFSLLVAVLLAVGTFTQSEPQSFRPKNGFVPDEKTAIAVARAILGGVYGEKQIASEEPLTASLHGGVWTISGTLPASTPNGGVAEIDISKKTGAVLRAIHGK